MGETLQIVPLVLMSLLFSACCKPKVAVKTEYIECEYPDILDLNYTNDTNYSVEPIEYEIINKDWNVGENGEAKPKAMEEVS